MTILAQQLRKARLPVHRPSAELRDDKPQSDGEGRDAQRRRPIGDESHDGDDETNKERDRDGPPAY